MCKLRQRCIPPYALEGDLGRCLVKAKKCVLSWSRTDNHLTASSWHWHGGEMGLESQIAYSSTWDRQQLWKANAFIHAVVGFSLNSNNDKLFPFCCKLLFIAEKLTTFIPHLQILQSNCYVFAGVNILIDTCPRDVTPIQQKQGGVTF